MNRKKTNLKNVDWKKIESWNLDCEKIGWEKINKKKSIEKKSAVKKSKKRPTVVELTSDSFIMNFLICSINQIARMCIYSVRNEHVSRRRISFSINIKSILKNHKYHIWKQRLHPLTFAKKLIRNLIRRCSSCASKNSQIVFIVFVLNE